MNCPDELELSMYSDGALDADATARLEAHIANCQSCQVTVSAQRAEVEWLSAALMADPVLDPDEAHVVVPPLAWPAPRGTFASWGGLLLGIAASIAAAPALLELALKARFSWFGTALTFLDSLLGGGLTNTAIRSTLFLVRNGDAIMKLITETLAAAAIVGFAAWIATAFGRRSAVPLTLAVAVFAVTLMPAPSHALEIRTADEGTVRIEANETIDDTLIALGETVEIDGNVDGDLIAAGKTVVVRGRVSGNLVTGAQSVTISGDIGGSVIGAGQTVNVTSAQIGRNLFGFGNVLNASESSRVEQNAVMFSGQAANLAGPVGRDVYSFGSQVEIGGTIGGDLNTFGPNVSILSPARIGGDFSARTPNETGISVSPGATIGGEQTIDIQERSPRERGNKYANPGWYGSQLLRFLAAFVTGLVILALIPGLRNVSITGVGNGLINAGIGLIALVATPIIALLVMITVIGIPLALLSVMLYVASLYLAKVVLAFFIGRQIFGAGGKTRHYALTLAVGLAAVIVAINLPFIGGVLNFVLMIAGLGLIVMFAWAQIKSLSAQPQAAA